MRFESKLSRVCVNELAVEGRVMVGGNAGVDEFAVAHVRIGGDVGVVEEVDDWR